jgi:PAS domain S-box-containing protein
MNSMDLRTLDYRNAFELAPVGLVLSRERQMLDCNQELLAMFGAKREQIIGQSFEILYPTADEFERTGRRIAAELDSAGRYADERVMKRLSSKSSKSLGTSSGPRSDDLFWCHVSGRALDRRSPHAAGIWVFEDLSSTRVLSVELTPREREVSALLIQGLTSKLVGKRLDISPRTVDVYRSRLMRKLGAATTTELVHKLLQGRS